jgi:hypothetical protein
MLSGAVNAAGSSEPGMEEVMAEGIPHPPVIVSIKEYKADRSNSEKADFLTEGIPHPKIVQPLQHFIGDLDWPSREEMMAEDNVLVPPRKIEEELAEVKL